MKKLIMNFIFQKLCYLLNCHFFNIFTSTFIIFLYNKRCISCINKNKKQINVQKTSSSILLKKKCSFRLPSSYIIAKTLQYAIMIIIGMRAFYVSLLFDHKTNSTDSHLLYNPLIVSVVRNLKFFNSTVLKCVCQLAIFSFFIDYLLYFHIDFRMLKAAKEIVVENGRYFIQLNSDVNNKNKHLKSWLTISSFWYRALTKRIWTTKSSLLKFNKPTLASFPHLSTKLRAQVAVYSALLEGVVFGVNIITCKCVNKTIISF